MKVAMEADHRNIVGRVSRVRAGFGYTFFFPEPGNPPKYFSRPAYRPVSEQFALHLGGRQQQCFKTVATGFTLIFVNRH